MGTEADDRSKLAGGACRPRMTSMITQRLEVGEVVRRSRCGLVSTRRRLRGDPPSDAGSRCPKHALADLGRPSVFARPDDSVSSGPSIGAVVTPVACRREKSFGIQPPKKSRPRDFTFALTRCLLHIPPGKTVGSLGADVMVRNQSSRGRARRSAIGTRACRIEFYGTVVGFLAVGTNGALRAAKWRAK